MNRRSFISSLIAGVVAPAFLKGAGRNWKRTESGLMVNPEWVDAEYDIIWVGMPHLSEIQEKMVSPFYREPSRFIFNPETNLYAIDTEARW